MSRSVEILVAFSKTKVQPVSITDNLFAGVTNVAVSVITTVCDCRNGAEQSVRMDPDLSEDDATVRVASVNINRLDHFRTRFKSRSCWRFVMMTLDNQGLLGDVTVVYAGR